jgi:hypothetical protein
MYREYETIKLRIKEQGTQGKGFTKPEFEEISTLEYLEFFKNRMLLDNSPVAIMTLMQYYKKLQRVLGMLEDGEDDIFRPVNNERRLKIVEMIQSRAEVSTVIFSVLKNYSGLKFDKQV